jgi:hypothetical protein
MGSNVSNQQLLRLQRRLVNLLRLAKKELETVSAHGESYALHAIRRELRKHEWIKRGEN